METAAFVRICLLFYKSVFTDIHTYLSAYIPTCPCKPTSRAYLTTYGYVHIHYITLHYITLHYITLHYITLHYITLHYITLHYITLHYTTLHYTTLHYITLHYITLHYITLHYITLHYITLHYINITLHYVTLRYVTLRYVTLHYITLHNNPSCSRAPTHPPGTRTIFSFRRRLVASVPCSAGSPGPAPFGLHLAPSYLTSGKELTSPPSLPRGDAFSSPSLHFFLFFFLSFVPQQGTG